MKLFNKSLAGKKVKTSSGEFEVDKDGYCTVTDKDLQKILLSSGFIDVKKMEEESEEIVKESKKEFAEVEKSRAEKEKHDAEQYERSMKQKKEFDEGNAKQRMAEHVANRPEVMNTGREEAAIEHERQEAQKPKWVRSK